MQTPPSASDTPVLRPGRFLLWFGGIALLLFAGNLLLSALNIGRATNQSAGFCRNIDARIALGNAMARPKLVVIGGSSVRRGFSLAMIGEHFAVPALNFGLQAAMGPELILSDARKVLKPGDTAILALEYSQYVEDRWNRISLDVLFDCQIDYFRQLPISEKIEVLMAVSPARLLNVIRHARRRGDPEANVTAETPQATRAIAHGDLTFGPRDYPPLSSRVRARVAAYGPTPIALMRQARGTAAIADFVGWARANHIKVAMTWPNTIGFSAYRTMPGFADIRNFYTGLGVPVIGEPQLGFYPATLFYDTQYHLVPEGILRRTDDFIAEMEHHRQLLPTGG